MAELESTGELGFRRRIAVEFGVIVLSILAAFALEAWWSDRVDTEQTRARVETLANEFTATRSDLAIEVEGLDAARTALAALLGSVSPTAPMISMDSITTLLDLSFRAATIELRSGSLQALLASGDLADIEDPDLTALLAAWPADLARLRRQSGLLEQNRELIIDYLHDRIPTLQIAEKTGEMDAYPRSVFAGAPEAVQRDMKIEGLLGNRGILLEDTERILRDLDARAERILTLIRPLL